VLTGAYRKYRGAAATTIAGLTAVVPGATLSPARHGQRDLAATMEL
jgi:hypothetical protein